MTELCARTLRQLRSDMSELQARGIRSMALGGSVARGTQGPDSDVDLVVELDPAMRIGVFAFVGIQRRIEERLGRKTDLLDRKALHADVLASLERDAISVF